MRSSAPYPRTLILLVAAVLATAYSAWRIFWVGPEKTCIAHHRVWDPKQRTCASPVIVQRGARI